MASAKMCLVIVLLGLAAVVVAQTPPNRPAPGSKEETLARNFGFQPGQTPPPGALASPSHPGPAHGSDEARLASNFGLKEGQTPPPGTLASPSKHH